MGGFEGDRTPGETVFALKNDIGFIIPPSGPQLLAACIASKFQTFNFAIIIFYINPKMTLLLPVTCQVFFFESVW